jgi:hypothetical protein
LHPKQAAPTACQAGILQGNTGAQFALAIRETASYSASDTDMGADTGFMFCRIACIHTGNKYRRKKDNVVFAVTFAAIAIGKIHHDSTQLMNKIVFMPYGLNSVISP